jgi:hypothetical protein
MDQELQTLETDADAGQEDVSSEGLDVSQLNAITGREFKDVDDFKKHYTNLNSFVGKKDEAGEKLKSILSKAEPYASKYGLNSEEFLNYYLTNPAATEDDIREHFNQRTAKKEDTEIHSKVSRLEFLVENPEAKNDIKLIETLARGMGVSFEEAYATPEFKKLANANRETKGTSVINSNTKVSISASEQKKAYNRVLNERSTDSLANYLKETGFGDK